MNTTSPSTSPDTSADTAADVTRDLQVVDDDLKETIARSVLDELNRKVLEHGLNRFGLQFHARLDRPNRFETYINAADWDQALRHLKRVVLIVSPHVDQDANDLLEMEVEATFNPLRVRFNGLQVAQIIHQVGQSFQQTERGRRLLGDPPVSRTAEAFWLIGGMIVLAILLRLLFPIT